MSEQEQLEELERVKDQNKFLRNVIIEKDRIILEYQKLCARQIPNRSSETDR